MKYTNGRTVITSVQILEHHLLNIPTQVKPWQRRFEPEYVAGAQAASASDFWKYVAVMQSPLVKELLWRSLSVWFIDDACFSQGNPYLWYQSWRHVSAESCFGRRLWIFWKAWNIFKRWINAGIVKRGMILENINIVSDDIWWRLDKQFTAKLYIAYYKLNVTLT